MQIRRQAGGPGAAAGQLASYTSQLQSSASDHSCVQEWVATIGSQAGLTSDNSGIFSGAIGVPESRLEVLPASTLSQGWSLCMLTAAHLQ